jgi:hypothetical protein
MVTASGLMFNFISPICLSSSSKACGLLASYLIGENASLTSACFNPAASLVMITTDRFLADRCFLMAALTSAALSFDRASRIMVVNSGVPYHCESSA